MNTPINAKFFLKAFKIRKTYYIIKYKTQDNRWLWCNLLQLRIRGRLGLTSLWKTEWFRKGKRVWSLPSDFWMHGAKPMLMRDSIRLLRIFVSILRQAMSTSVQIPYTIFRTLLRSNPGNRLLLQIRILSQLKLDRLVRQKDTRE